MHYIRMLIVGLVVGLLASWLYGRFFPGVHLGALKATVVGILGSYLFGLVGRLFHPSTQEPFHPAGFLYSIIGALALIFVGVKLNLLH